ncbi:MAG: 50S ribosomal protein L22 [Spirochaetales bacterium]
MAKNLREKTAKIEANKDKRPMAFARNIKMEANKVAVVLDTVRGKKYSQAVAILENLSDAAATPILKLLNSAAANAENNLSLNKDNLFVAEAYSGQGPTYKRLLIRARGRADRRLRRTCNITVILDTVNVA